MATTKYYAAHRWCSHISICGLNVRYPQNDEPDMVVQEANALLERIKN